MSGKSITDVTAVVANWLTARRTLGAIKSFRKFYPDIPLIVVDDDSNEKDKSTFYISYSGHNTRPDLEFDPDVDKLRDIDNKTIFLQVPPHKHFGKGEGAAIDLAMENIKTKWMFHFHSDYRFAKGGIIEEFLSRVDDNVCAVGIGKTKHPKLPALSGVVELISVELGKKYSLSYRPIIYYPNGTIAPLLSNLRGGVPIPAGGYYTGYLSQKGYRVVHVGIHNKYGVHMRWTGNIEEWKKLY